MLHVVPDTFIPISKDVFVINGEEHSQDVYYDEETEEMILSSPAHSGYPDTTTVIAPKSNISQLATKLMCNEDNGQFNTVHDELFLDPAIFLNKSKNNITETNNTITKTYYIIRSNHRILTKEEYQNLPESMKLVSKGKSIMKSDSHITTE